MVDDLRQRSGSRNHAGGHAPVIAVAQHDGQRKSGPWKSPKRPPPGGGGQHGATKITARPGRRASGQTAGRWFPAGLRPCRCAQYQPHEREEWNRQRCVVLHDAENAQQQGLQQRLGRMPSSMPTKPKNRPQAPRLNATGKPSSRKQDGARKHDGAMLLMRNCMVVCPGSGVLGLGFGRQADGLASSSSAVMATALAVGSSIWAHEEGHTFDQFRPALQQQQ